MKRFQRILVHADSHAKSPTAVERAAELAKEHGAELTIVDVVPEFGWPLRMLTGGYERVIEEIAHVKDKRLAELTASLEGLGVPATTKLLSGRTSREIAGEAVRGGYDLVVKDAKGRRSRRPGFFGTSATRLLRECPCAILLLKPGHVGPWKRVLAAVDATPHDTQHAQLNTRILDLATACCELEEGQLHVIHVWGIYGESLLREHMQPAEFEELERKTEAASQKGLDDLVMKYGLGVGLPQVHHERGDPGELVPKLVAELNADLLVLGTVGRTGVAGMLIGNTAEQVLGRVECSVLAVRPEGVQSPQGVESPESRVESQQG